jgi:integrase/recombinase XerC
MVRDFERFLTEQDLAAKSIAEYAGAVKRFLQWKETGTGVPFCPEQLRVQDLAEYVGYLSRHKKLSPSTINKNQGGLRKWLEYLQKTRGWEGAVHLPDMKCPRQQREPDSYQPHEVAAILLAIEREPNGFLRARDRCICYFELYRGIRIGESLSLRMEDVILTPGNQRLILRSGKGGRQDDTEIDIRCRRLLGAILDWMEVRSASAFADSPYFFVSRRSGQMTYGAAEKMMQRISGRARLQFRTSWLRHTFLKQSMNIGAFRDDVEF